jgi:predicted ester cyclase
LFEQWFAAVPDLAATIDDMIASGDKVFVRSTISGTQTGEFLGMPPTGKSFSIGSMDIVRIQDDQAIEHWGIQDTMAMMTQLGLMPPPAGGEHDH